MVGEVIVVAWNKTIEQKAFQLSWVILISTLPCYQLEAEPLFQTRNFPVCDIPHMTHVHDDFGFDFVNFFQDASLISENVSAYPIFPKSEFGFACNHRFFYTDPTHRGARCLPRKQM